MDRSYTMPRLCFLLTAALTVFSTVLRSLCMIFYFDADPGYFTGDLMPVLSNVLYFIAAVAAILCSCLIPKGTLPQSLHIRMRAPTSLLLGLSLSLFTVISFVACFPSRQSNIMLAPTLLGLLASTYYFVSANRNGRYPDWLAFLGYLPILWSVAAVGEVYFDNYTTMNSPIKIALQTAFLGFMFIALAELRFRVGRPMPRYSVALLSMGSFACLTASVPILIATGARILDNVLHLLYAVVLLFAGLYGLYLLFRYTCFSSDAPAEETAEAGTDNPTETVPNVE